MKLCRTPVALSEAFANFAEDSSYALVLLSEVPTHHNLSTIREAARLCDVVVAYTAFPIRQPKPLEHAGCDVLLHLPMQATPLEVVEVGGNTQTGLVQAMVATLPSIVLVNAVQLEQLAVVQAVVNTFPTLTSPRLWVTPETSLTDVEKHWHSIVRNVPVGRVGDCAQLITKITQTVEKQAAARGVRAAVCLGATGQQAQTLKETRWLSLLIATHTGEDVATVVPWPLK